MGADEPTSVTMEDLDEALKAVPTSAIPTGLPSLDGMLKPGLCAGELVVVGGRAGVGKTALATTIARGAARAGFPVAFLTLEMSELELYLRLISAESRLPLPLIRAGFMRDQDWSVLIEALQELPSLPLSVGSAPAADPGAVASFARAELGDRPAESLLVVDGLQLLSPEPGRERASRAEELADAVRSLKAIALELGIVVLVTSQADGRGGSWPAPADLGGRGSIEQVADVVLLMDRHATRKGGEGPEGGSAWDTDLALAKNRFGRAGEVPGRFAFLAEAPMLVELEQSDPRGKA